MKRGGIVLVLLLVLSACSSEDAKEIRLAPTSTVEAGVRAIIDNCPSPAALTLSVRAEVLWRIERVTTGDVATPNSNTAGEPGLVEFLVGETPEGWREVQQLEQLLSEGTRYTLATEPNLQTIDFSLPDLAPGLVFNGVGRSQFSPNLMRVECSQPADVGLFARNMVVLVALWVTAAALVMVALILVLFVVTRRFSRIGSIERRAARDAQSAQRPTPGPTGRPRARSRS